MASYIYWRGGRFNSSAIPSLLMAEKKSGHAIRVTQGGYNRGGVAASAGTHDGGGVIDISVLGWSTATMNDMVLWLRRCGWAAWHRTPAQGFAHHIHAVRIGDMSASYGARAQVVAYRNGRNGLAGNGRDDGPRPGYVTWENSKYNPKNNKGGGGGAGGSGGSKPAPYIINGKKYPHMSSVNVKWINDARASSNRGHKYVSRPVHRLQCWLRKYPGHKFYTSSLDGVWGPKTQAAFDAYRHSIGLKGNDAKGPVGVYSVTRLRDKVKSTYKIVAK